MRYLIAELQATGKRSPDAIVIIPVTEHLTHVLHTCSSLADHPVERLRPKQDEEIHGYLLADSLSLKTKANRVEYFRKLLLNELDGHEFLFLDECELLNEEILSDLAERFSLVIEVLLHAAYFLKQLDGMIQYTTYSIPLTCMPLQTKSICGN